jgi:hypothetical protein
MDRNGRHGSFSRWNGDQHRDWLEPISKFLTAVDPL